MSESAPNHPFSFPHPDDLHDRFKRDPESWLCCQFAGIQPGLPGQFFELRQCPHCHSSLAKPCSLAQARQILAQQQALLSHARELLP